jgi:hypothetical protein
MTSIPWEASASARYPASTLGSDGRLQVFTVTGNTVKGAVIEVIAARRDLLDGCSIEVKGGPSWTGREILELYRQMPK